jgi:hypothetical protein
MALAPPIADAPLSADGTQHSEAWTAYNQAVADRLDRLPGELRTGVTDGSNAATGQIGEWLSSVVASGSGLANNIPVNVTTLALTAGDWDVRGEVWFTLGGGPTGDVEAGIGLTSATIPGTPGVGSRVTQNWVHTPGTGQVLALASSRLSLAAAGTAYLVAEVGYSSGTAPVAYGRIEARRVR